VWAPATVPGLNFGQNRSNPIKFEFQTHSNSRSEEQNPGNKFGSRGRIRSSSELN
jgi:hypothetical protein